VISISWGGAEVSWTEQSMQNFDEVAQEAGLLGITISAAGQNVGTRRRKVDVVLACGGTELQVANGSITSETVWNDGAQGGATGGGFSAVFARPSWQIKDVPQLNRGVPDVAGDADPETGYKVQVDGQQLVVGGTSAVAPLWAGLITLLNQKLQSRIGFINPLLYNADEATCFRDITAGNNGAYSAAHGWDATTGLGSPVGISLIQTIQATASQSQVSGKDVRSPSSPSQIR